MSTILKYLKEEEFSLRDVVRRDGSYFWDGCLYEVRKIIHFAKEIE